MNRLNRENFKFSQKIEELKFSIHGHAVSATHADIDVGGVVLWVLAVGVEVYRPLVSSYREHLARDVFFDSDLLRQRVSLYHELMRPVHRLCHRPQTRSRCQHTAAAAVATAHGVHLNQPNPRDQTMYVRGLSGNMIFFAFFFPSFSGK